MNNNARKLLSKDPKLKNILKSDLDFEFKVTKNLYAAIVRNIIGQQLSSRPAEIILKRFTDLFPRESFPKPEVVLKMTDQKLRNCGMSWSKVKYVKNLSQSVTNKEIVFTEIINMPDEKVIEILTKVNGIGRWTAEMILIFHLGREDVFSVGDLGLRSAVAKLYNVEREDLKAIQKISENWKPYRSYASRLLWEYADSLKKHD